MIELTRVVPRGTGRVLLKLEQFNPTGSYKDRMAKAIIEQAEATGRLKAGMTILECTSGSTGMSLAFVAACKGYPFRVVTSDAFAPEKLKGMRAFGANLELIESNGRGVTPDLMPSLIERARTLARQPGHYWADQFHNPDALPGYASMGEEILQQAGGEITAFCGAVGTAGMLMGVAKVLKREAPNAKIIALEPASSPTITAGKPGAHRIDGIAGGFVPPLLNGALYDEARTVEEETACEITRRLARQEGIFAGLSTGVNVAAAIRLAQEHGPGSTIVTVAADTGLKYLAGDLFT